MALDRGRCSLRGGSGGPSLRRPLRLTVMKFLPCCMPSGLQRMRRTWERNFTKKVCASSAAKASSQWEVSGPGDREVGYSRPPGPVDSGQANVNWAAVQRQQDQQGLPGGAVRVSAFRAAQVSYQGLTGRGPGTLRTRRRRANFRQVDGRARRVFSFAGAGPPEPGSAFLTSGAALHEQIDDFAAQGVRRSSVLRQWCSLGEGEDQGVAIPPSRPGQFRAVVRAGHERSLPGLLERLVRIRKPRVPLGELRPQWRSRSG
jgi:hypothetical protein